MTPPRPACSYVETVGVPCEYPAGLLDQPLPATGGSTTVLLVVAGCLVVVGGVLRKAVS